MNNRSKTKKRIIRRTTRVWPKWRKGCAVVSRKTSPMTWKYRKKKAKASLWRRETLSGSKGKFHWRDGTKCKRKDQTVEAGVTVWVWAKLSLKSVLIQITQKQATWKHKENCSSNLPFRSTSPTRFLEPSFSNSTNLPSTFKSQTHTHSTKIRFQNRRCWRITEMSCNCKNRKIA